MNYPTLNVENPNPAEAQCHGKRSFHSPKLAWQIVRRNPRRKDPREAYRCRFCGKWRVGAQR